jgi:hypothetical protein
MTKGCWHMDEHRKQTIKRHLSGHRIRGVRGILIGMLVMLWQLGGVRIASAHGIDRLLQEEQVSIGDCLLTIWTSPSRWRPGEVHVDVQVRQSDGTLSTKQFVQVLVTPEGQRSAAQKSIAQPLEISSATQNAATHEARFHLTQSGNYEVTVAVSDKLAYLGGVSFEIEVVPVSLATKILLHLLLLGSLVVGYWLMSIGKRVWLPAHTA